jgi:hypothetical protein
LTSALAGGEWSASRPGRFTPGERAPGIHWMGRWVGPRAGLGDVEKRKFFTLPGLELGPLGRPARSQSLYRLRYPGSWILGCENNRSLWPRGLRHKLFAGSNTGIVGSNPACGIYVCVRLFCVCAVLCVQVAALRRANPRPRSPTGCVNDQETEKQPGSNKRAVEP